MVYRGKWWRRLTTGVAPISGYLAEARSWQTCAVSEAAPLALGLEDKEGPEDYSLMTLGIHFEHAVRANQRSKARNIYRKIARRAAQIIKENKTVEPETSPDA